MHRDCESTSAASEASLRAIVNNLPCDDKEMPLDSSMIQEESAVAPLDYRNVLYTAMECILKLNSKPTRYKVIPDLVRTSIAVFIAI